MFRETGPLAGRATSKPPATSIEGALFRSRPETSVDSFAAVGLPTYVAINQIVHGILLWFLGVQRTHGLTRANFDGIIVSSRPSIQTWGRTPEPVAMWAQPVMASLTAAAASRSTVMTSPAQLWWVGCSSRWRGSADGGLEEFLESRPNRASGSAIRACARSQMRGQAHHQRRQLLIRGLRRLGHGHNPDDRRSTTPQQRA